MTQQPPSPSLSNGVTMAKPSPPPSLLLFSLLLLLLLSHPPPSSASLSFSFTQLRTLSSLGHSLATRVANLRASRGDIDGARRARLIADKLDNGLSLKFWASIVWDYVRNYAWRDTASFGDAFGIASEFNELLSSLTELARMGSDSERAAWVARNYRGLLRVSKSVFNRLLSVFSKSGPLREVVEILKREMEGDFLKDCLEVGTSDLKGMVEILKNLAFQYTNVDRDEL